MKTFYYISQLRYITLYKVLKHQYPLINDKLLCVCQKLFMNREYKPYIGI